MDVLALGAVLALSGSLTPFATFHGPLSWQAAEPAAVIRHPFNVSMTLPMLPARLLLSILDERLPLGREK
jgi:hypothetical protein